MNSISNNKTRNAKTLLLKWLPVIITAFIIFGVPPAAIAVIAAYFTVPILQAVRAVTRLPLTIATLLVMTLMLLITFAFSYVALHGIIESVPAIEKQLNSLTKNTDIVGEILTFLEEKIIQYGQAILEYSIGLISTIFQHIFSLFIFLVAYFFALRESGKDRFWFLVYFPVKIRKQTKKMLEQAGKLIGTYISVEARLIFLTFIIVAIGFSFLGFNSPIGSAFLISLVDSLPFLGIGLFLIPMATFFFITGNLFVGISLLLLFLLTMLTRQIVESYLWASTFQVKPIHAFFILACTVYLFGIIGVLLTPFLLFAAMKIKEHPFFTSR